MSEAPRDYLEQLIKNPPTDSELDRLLSGALNESVFVKFSKDAYSFPFTWWIGLLQVSMLAGAWGARHQRAAQIRQQALAQSLYQW
ncbi:hypothetical protein sS8_0089 [Methylocaldum marinum]|uniref:Uncharacterized protein n=1 Tax=Methylocaldum marinum TaxID=1432792 RepID=A0A286T7B7_9GAMM|nr:hypothetical protein [Methylocaldum marinum]BBA32058.1 hypothetical protein sS8_0089 [Methylocaldum marinum]